MLEPGVVPGSGTGEHEWIHTQHGEPINSGKAPSANEALAAAEQSHAELSGGWDPSAELAKMGSHKTAWPGKKAPQESPTAGQLIDRKFDFLPHESGGYQVAWKPDPYASGPQSTQWLNKNPSWTHKAQGDVYPSLDHAVGAAMDHLQGMGMMKGADRKTAWSGWGPAQVPRHHVAADWEWDNHLNGYVGDRPRIFTCACGEEHKVPGYANCKCGKIWNSYVIGTGGDRHEASAEKFICREIPARKNVLVAKKAQLVTAEYDDYDSRLNDWEHQDESETAFPSDHHPSTPQGKSFPDDWHHRDTQQRWTKGH